MSKIAPREAFTAGHNIAYTGVYFDQVVMAARLRNTNSENAKVHSDKMIETLQQLGALFAQRLQHVHVIAKEGNIQIPPLPTLPPEYQSWAPITHKKLSQIWLPNHVEAWLFQLGYSLGELRGALILFNLCLDFQLNLGLSVTKDLDLLEKRLKDVQIPLSAATQQLERFPIGLPFVNLHKMIAPILSKLGDLMQDESATAGQIIAVVAPLIRRLSLVEKEEATGLPSSVTG